VLVVEYLVMIGVIDAINPLGSYQSLSVIVVDHNSLMLTRNVFDVVNFPIY
jgi:hypothetical protein